MHRQSLVRDTKDDTNHDTNRQSCEDRNYQPGRQRRSFRYENILYSTSVTSVCHFFIVKMYDPRDSCGTLLSVGLVSRSLRYGGVSRFE
jgi:hypothetical protein